MVRRVHYGEMGKAPTTVILLLWSMQAPGVIATIQVHPQAVDWAVLGMEFSVVNTISYTYSIGFQFGEQIGQQSI